MTTYYHKGVYRLIEKKPILPDYESVTPFLKGQASKIFKSVADNDNVLIVQKQNKPQIVIISYERYKKY